MEGEGEEMKYSTSLLTSMMWVSSLGTTKGGVEVDETGDSFEGAQERSDIGEWRIPLLELSFYAGMVGLEGVFDGKWQLILG